MGRHDIGEPARDAGAGSAGLQQARGTLAHAELVAAAPARFAAGLTAARFVAAAVLAVRPPRGRPATDPWRALAAAVPEFGEWAGFFAACGQRLRPGAAATVTSREADDLVRDANRFCEDAARWIARHRSGSARGTA
ncbi:SAV_6107 family HEPN domain-containing protein [Propionicicella superfundia]|uniref:SAV_6107 family HEPN domain-containing protein n=1 Tax=Propionicicella superfundia TaxID=348582 RepID=UPI0003F85B8C|nr:SAV_6107 family HEPN domain-containing protein [Propionicicella superfundia]